MTLGVQIRGLLLLLILGCTNPPIEVLGTGEVVRVCAGEFRDGGRYAVSEEFHFGKGVDRVAGAALARSLDGGVCVRSLGVPADFALCESGQPCSGGAFVAPAFETVRAVAFPVTPPGGLARQAIQVVNRTSNALLLSIASGSSNFSATPTRRVEGHSSSSIVMTFTPDRAGAFRSNLHIGSNLGETVDVELIGSGDGPNIVVQSFVDAGILVMDPSRQSERRGLRIENRGGVLPFPAQAAQQARVIECRPGELASVLTVGLGPVPQLGSGEYFIADLFLGGAGAGDCRVQLELAQRQYYVDVTFDGREVELCSILNPDILVSAAQRTYLVPVRAALGRCYVSWPRVEADGGGVALKSDWSEAILDAGEERMVEISVDGVPGPATRFVVDGNGLAGRFVWRIVGR